MRVGQHTAALVSNTLVSDFLFIKESSSYLDALQLGSKKKILGDYNNGGVKQIMGE